MIDLLAIYIFFPARARALQQFSVHGQCRKLNMHQILGEAAASVSSAATGLQDGAHSKDVT
jgi:hypothetical protein